MNITAGLILLFLNVFLPGLLFLRFYFTGEFSKQFSTRIPFIRLTFYAFLPGLLFLGLGLMIYNLWDENFTLFVALEVFTDLLNSNANFTSCTENFLKNQIHLYLIFTILCSVFAVLSALFAHKVVRDNDWDIRFKILRFKNQWYYVFNGDVLRFKKYKNISKEINVTQLENLSKNIMLAYADVLVREADGIHLYSGVVMDYDLNSLDTSKLDKLYLMDAHKHIMPTDKRKKKREKTPIPGQIFILNDEQILNINLTYVPSVMKKEEILHTVEKRKKRWAILWQSCLSVSEWILSALFVLFAYYIFKGNTGFRFFNYVNVNFNFVQKIYLILTVLAVLSTIFAYKKSMNKTDEELKPARNGMYLLTAIQLFIFLWEMYLGRIVYGLFE